MFSRPASIARYIQLAISKADFWVSITSVLWMEAVQRKCCKLSVGLFGGFSCTFSGQNCSESDLLESFPAPFLVKIAYNLADYK